MTRNEKINKLLELHDRYAECEACKLYTMRKRSMRGMGNPDAGIVFVVERASPEETKLGSFLASERYNLILDTLFEFAGRQRSDFWFTPLVACPTTIISANTSAMPVETTPLPKNKEIAACRPRILEEIHIIAPRLVVAMGQHAAKALIQKDPMTLHYNLGEIHEGSIVGDYGTYPMPVMLTHSLHTLLTQPDLSADGLWNKVAKHIAEAVEIVSFLEGVKWVE